MVDEPLDITDEASEIEDVAPGETKSVVWTITDPEPYQISCHVPGHYEGGKALPDRLLSPLKFPDFT